MKSIKEYASINETNQDTKETTAKVMLLLKKYGFKFADGKYNVPVFLNGHPYIECFKNVYYGKVVVVCVKGEFKISTDLYNKYTSMTQRELKQFIVVLQDANKLADELNNMRKDLYDNLERV